MSIIPSRRWFPLSPAARAAWFMNFFVQFSTVATSLGFKADDITAVDNDNQVMQFLADTDVQIDAYKEAVRQYRIGITELEIGKKTPAFPANPTFALPVVVPAGIFERLNDLVARIRVAPNYTDEIGALLGILPTKTDKPSPDTLKPVATAVAEFAGYKFTVHATRMGMPAYKVQIRRMDSDAWQDAGTSMTSDIEITVTPTVPGKPERLQMRVILMNKNQFVGEPSDAVYVTVNP